MKIVLINNSNISWFTILLFLISIFVRNSSGQGQKIDESNPAITINITENQIIEQKFVELKRGTTRILVKNIPSTAGFFILQTHSFAQPLTITNTTEFGLHNSINGTNIGLAKILLPTDYTKTFPYLVYSKTNITVLIVVSVYNKNDPIPGGCSMTFNTDISPYLKVDYDNYLISVDYQQASILNHYCEENLARHEMYYMKFDHANFNSKVYFDQIQKFLTVEDIKKYGHIVPDFSNTYRNRKLLSAYLGTGTIFAVIASTKEKSSVYTPAVTYSCDITNGSDSCYNYNVIYWDVLNAIAIVIGVYLFIFGPSYILFSGYLIITTTIFYSSDSLLVLLTNLGEHDVILIEWIIAGTIFILMAIICRNNNNDRSLITMEMASFFITGFLLSAVLLTGPFDQSDLLKRNNIFWILFIADGLIFTMIMYHFGRSEGFCFTLLGLFLIFMSTDYFLQGPLSHAITEIWRKAMVTNYISAVNIYSFEFLTTMWKIIGITILAFIAKCFRNKYNGDNRITTVIRRIIVVRNTREGYEEL